MFFPPHPAVTRANKKQKRLKELGEKVSNGEDDDEDDDDDEEEDDE